MLASHEAASWAVPAAPSHVDASENGPAGTPLWATSLTTSKARPHSVVRYRHSRGAVSLSPSRAWTLKAVATLLVLVLVKYYATRYVQCLRRVWSSKRITLPTAGKNGKSGSNILRRLAVGHDDTNITASPAAGGSSHETSVDVCRRELAEEVEVGSHTSLEMFDFLDEESSGHDSGSMYNDSFTDMSLSFLSLSRDGADDVLETLSYEPSERVRMKKGNSRTESLVLAMVGIGVLGIIVGGHLYEKDGLEQAGLTILIASACMAGLFFSSFVASRVIHRCHKRDKDQVDDEAPPETELPTSEVFPVDPDTAVGLDAGVQALSPVAPAEESLASFEKPLLQEGRMRAPSEHGTASEMVPLKDVDTDTGKESPDASPLREPSPSTGQFIVENECKRAVTTPSGSGHQSASSVALEGFGQSEAPIPVEDAGNTGAAGSLEASDDSGASASAKQSGQSGDSTAVEDFGDSGQAAPVEGSCDSGASAPAKKPLRRRATIV